MSGLLKQNGIPVLDMLYIHYNRFYLRLIAWVACFYSFNIFYTFVTAPLSLPLIRAIQAHFHTLMMDGGMDPKRLYIN